MDKLLNEYLRLNNSFRKKMVFHLGYNAGFFSEYNNMVLCMLYCLENKIKFVLYSKTANFGFERGWEDFFLPFCDSTEKTFHTKYNFRPRYISRRERVIIPIFKCLKNIDYLTQDLWNNFHSRELEKQQFDIPELGIKGELVDACNVLVNMTWNYNKSTEGAIDALIKKIKLPSEYLGFHIRSGDKFLESPLLQPERYIIEAMRYSSLRKAFVLTDDFLILKNLRNEYPDWDFLSLCKEEEKGYFFCEFQKQNKDIIKDAHLRLFASIDILSKSENCFGTFSTNPGMYLGMRMQQGKMKSLDIKNWQIW